MQTKWFNHLKDKEEQERFKSLVLGSQKVLDRLKEICYNTVNDGEVTKSDYDCPSWAFKQAHLNGRKEALQEIIELLTLEKEPLTNGPRGKAIRAVPARDPGRRRS